MSIKSSDDIQKKPSEIVRPAPQVSGTACPQLEEPTWKSLSYLLKSKGGFNTPPPPHVKTFTVCYLFLCSKFISEETPWLGRQAIKWKVQTV